jgi:RND family efflux transporter MFP subunit
MFVVLLRLGKIRFLSLISAIFFLAVSPMLFADGKNVSTDSPFGSFDTSKSVTSTINENTTDKTGNDLSLTGIIQPVSSIEMSTSISGVVKDVYKDEGSFVSKDEIILKINDDFQILEVEKYKAAAFDDSMISSLRKKAVIFGEKITLMKKLRKETGSVSKEDLRTLELQQLANEAELNSAIEARKSQKILYEMAKEKLAQHKLTSPVNGVISDIEVQKGEWAESGKIVVRVIDDSSCYLETYINVKKIQSFKEKSKVSVLIDQGAGIVQKEGKIVFISPIADQGSELVRTKILFDNSDKKVVPGTNAKIAVE